MNTETTPSDASRRLWAFGLIFIQPLLLILVVAGGTYLFGGKDNNSLLVTFLAPPIALGGIAMTKLRTAAKIALAIVYLPLCAVVTFLMSAAIGCGVFPLRCW